MEILLYFVEYFPRGNSFQKQKFIWNNKMRHMFTWKFPWGEKVTNYTTFYLMMILEVVDGLVKRHMINEDKDP